MRTRSHEIRPVDKGRLDSAKCPPLGFDPGVAEEDATDAWLAHIAAGRITVR